MDVFQRLTNIATCLCAQVEEDNEGEIGLCFCGVVPGNTVAHEYMGDDCGDGMGWVRLVAIYPASGVGIVNTNPGNCSSLTGVDVELGIMRTMGVGDETGTPPTPEELFNATQQQVKDAMTMQRAIVCCQHEADWIIGQYQPFGPQGGVYGGVIEVNFLEQ